MSGYMYCTCRDCFELIVGEEGDYCDDCIEAGCPDYQGQKGMSQECQGKHAYGTPCGDPSCCPPEDYEEVTDEARS